MKKIIALLVIGLLAVNLHAQTAKVAPDPKLIEAFGTEQVNQWLKSKPDTILYLNTLVTEGFKVELYPEEKMVRFESVPIFTLKSKFAKEQQNFTDANVETLFSKVNVLKYDFTIDPLQITFYRLGDSNHIIIFYSDQQIKEIMNQKNNK